MPPAVVNCCPLRVMPTARCRPASATMRKPEMYLNASVMTEVGSAGGSSVGAVDGTQPNSSTRSPANSGSGKTIGSGIGPGNGGPSYPTYAPTMCLVFSGGRNQKLRSSGNGTAVTLYPRSSPIVSVYQARPTTRLGVVKVPIVYGHSQTSSAPA